MPKNEAAVARELEKQICMRCNARNPKRADPCRKCGHQNPRPEPEERPAA